MPQTVVVTGASAGIGRASAIAFGARGDTVARLARGQGGLAAAARDVEAAGGKAITIALDVADPDAVFAAAERVEREVGPIDVWVNVAFTSVFSPFSEITPAEYKRVTEVTYLGYVYSTMAAPALQEAAGSRLRGAGRIGAGLPWNPFADCVFRRQACDPGVSRGSAV